MGMNDYKTSQALKTASEVQEIEILLREGRITLNEARSLTGLNRINNPKCDVLFKQINHISS
ncbi:hypothetical protein [Brevibacillus brevis]|uniref:hypothetical protein n=1 Tax=Brevibacillus brevis TaxID=1393 RepID=UPI00116D3764|nr:hypothetical protein [Lysinibacillus sp. SDF0063]TQR33993.1 hypothetical protein C7Y45_18535 [Lysinibacillus sp. SDF0063]